VRTKERGRPESGKSGLINFTRTNGSGPLCTLVTDGSNNFYGTTTSGANNSGSIFKLTTSGTTGSLTDLYDFSGFSDGGDVEAGLTWGPDGNLYGTTRQKNFSSTGTIFKISKSGIFSSLVSFTGTNGNALGYDPLSALTLGGDGNLYGTTRIGGVYNLGTVFRVSLSGSLTNIWSFTGGVDGSNPTSAIVTSPLDGSLYGSSNNSIFHVVLASSQALLSGTVNPNGYTTTAYFNYGPTASYGQQTASLPLGSGTNAVAISQTINGLMPNTVYHCQLVANNSYGTSTGPDIVTSGSSTNTLPAAVTGTATTITSSAATLNATVNPDGLPTVYSFRYGSAASNVSTGTAPLASGNAAVPVNASISGLISGTTYYFHVVATNALGTIYGATGSFVTP
jgi:uncharacterized repeat protein (TIGR03803 family)